MISHELAAKLKAVGYPQKEYGNVFLWVTEKNYIDRGNPIHRIAHWKRFYTPRTHHFVNEWIYVPTLPELIDACPREREDYFFQIKAIKSGWEAGYFQYDSRLDYDDYFGSTLEEAVALLYLALHKK